MASVHSLFFSSNSDKQTLHKRIVPSSLQRERQQERWNELCDYLFADLAETSDYEIASWLQGSYKFGTQVRPASKNGEFDIDLGIYYIWSGDSASGSFAPKELKDMVQASMLRYKEIADDVTELDIPPKDRCARIHFSGGFHIDVPVYHLDKERDHRALATENNVWEESDPKAFYIWFRDRFSDGESTQIRRLIRYIKMWAALNLVNAPSSILLTVLVSDAYLNLSESDTVGDDVALRKIVEEILNKLSNSPEVLNPVDKTENLNRLSDEENEELIRKLRDLSAISSRALDAKTEFDAATIWSEAFHHFFPAPVQDTSEERSRSLVPVQFVPVVHVKAIPRNNPNRPFEGINRVGPIPRNCDIYFTLSNANELPAGSNVQWIVRNEGDEAEYKNDLGHLAGDDCRTAEEKSAYQGTHYMDVIVTQPIRGVIGFQRILVEISGLFMPERNSKKPGYTKVRTRR